MIELNLSRSTFSKKYKLSNSREIINKYLFGLQNYRITGLLWEYHNQRGLWFRSNYREIRIREIVLYIPSLTTFSYFFVDSQALWHRSLKPNIHVICWTLYTASVSTSRNKSSKRKHCSRSLLTNRVSNWWKNLMPIPQTKR